MTPDTTQARWRPNPNLFTWLAAAFGLAIVVGAAFVTGFLKWPLSGKPAVKPKPVIDVPSGRAELPSTPRQSSARPTEYDSDRGEQALAKLWSSVDAKKLVEITNSWKPFELAPILMRMKTDQLAELLAEMPAERAGAVSREIQQRSARGL